MLGLRESSAYPEAAILIQKFDLAELYQYEQARELSKELLKKWLVKYKFKNWRVTEKRKLKVTAQMKRQRAEEVANMLNDTDRWCSHARGIPMNALQRDLRLRIEDIEQKAEMNEAIASYYGLVTNYMATTGNAVAIHAGRFFLTFGG